MILSVGLRTTYNVFINVPKNNINTKNRKFTQMDMFPTTISAIGGKIEGERLSLGTNLFSNKKTLVERDGYNFVKKETYLTKKIVLHRLSSLIYINFFIWQIHI